MKKKILLVMIILVGLVTCNGIVNNYRVVTTTYDIKSNKVESDYTFVQISDYHSQTSDSEKILNITETSKPDYILLSGDILEASDMSETLKFVEDLMGISPVIYARGNHEDDYNTYQEFQSKLKEMGVIVLNSNNYLVDDLNFVGIEDFSGASLNYNDSFNSEYIPYIEDHQQLINDEKYNVLLAHRPNYLDTYASINADLVVSGHAHGGQWQIPFTNIGIIAPDEGLFPTHVEGLGQQGETYQAISAGTSNPYQPVVPRLFNPKEVVVINVKAIEE
ncbi:metallophosphoesterase [Mollicutes bacterium LVI A0039]|nr:metallophosphoesterase [Mollicutes bacterium LVI A0039]